MIYELKRIYLWCDAHNALKQYKKTSCPADSCISHIRHRSSPSWLLQHKIWCQFFATCWHTKPDYDLLSCGRWSKSFNKHIHDYFTTKPLNHNDRALELFTKLERTTFNILIKSFPTWRTTSWRPFTRVTFLKLVPANWNVLFQGWCVEFVGARVFSNQTLVSR